METLAVSLLLCVLLTLTGAAPMNHTTGPHHTTDQTRGYDYGGHGGHSGGGHGGNGGGYGGHSHYDVGHCAHLLDIQHLLVDFLPQCDMYGNFMPQQCFGGFCWCVDIYSGYELAHTHSTLGEDLHCYDYYCPSGWSYYDRRCYMFVDSPKSWVEAEGYCMYEGGNLASIHSYEESHFIKGLTRGYGYDFPETWVGGHDAIKDCVWMWSDGTKFHYDEWYKNMSTSPTDKCLKINHGCDWKWCPANCSSALPFVCSKMMTYTM